MAFNEESRVKTPTILRNWDINSFPLEKKIEELKPTLMTQFEKCNKLKDRIKKNIKRI